VAAFDRLGNTMLAMAVQDSGIPAEWVHRCIDDVPVVVPADSSAGARFLEAYTRMCADCNIDLAPPCPNLEKAFHSSREGTVLGVIFRTTDLSWSISRDKLDDIMRSISRPLLGDSMTLLDMQKLMGQLADFGQMCPFLKAFKLPLNMFLADLIVDPAAAKLMPSQAKKDLRVWAAVILDSAKYLPIPHQPGRPPLLPTVFVSDAAGARFVTVNGQRIPCDEPGERGAASLGVHPDGTVWYCCRMTWPEEFLLHAKDQLGRAYGCKSTFLELAGLIQPFLTIPEILQGREVLFLVDNLAVVYGWENRCIKNDLSASILIRAMHIVAAYLGCIAHVQHLPRMSTEEAQLADRLSRKSTTTDEDLRRIRHAVSPAPAAEFMEWLDSPEVDWNLPLRLLRAVQGRITRSYNN
jgi:hypothetical protein